MTQIDELAYQRTEWPMVEDLADDEREPTAAEATAWRRDGVFLPEPRQPPSSSRA
ncbi:hypothetical protein [Frankia sp. Cr1]|uniref:hypothetical protein n=1 Tax=Frankia sp. Cr1 TaxID=3073931 RepID=UPI002AD5AC2A|nr:hypothetical protein [Frankia sp. Cr1]